MPKPLIIGIAGPSGAGKSTVTKIIEQERKDVLRIKLDNYFNDISGFPLIDGEPNWDVPGNLNFDLLLKNLSELIDGKSTELPFFDKTTFKRVHKKTDPQDIILVEGFLIYFDERVRVLFDKKIYIDIPEDKQLERRLKRETPERASYIQKIVIPHYKIYGLPGKACADIVLSGDKTPEDLKSDILDLIAQIVITGKA